MALSIISINVNGLRDPDKRAGLIQWLHALPRLMLSVCKNVIVFLWKSARCGSHLLVFFVLCLRALTIRVGVLCCFGRLSLLFVLGLMIMAVF